MVWGADYHHSIWVFFQWKVDILSCSSNKKIDIEWKKYSSMFSVKSYNSLLISNLALIINKCIRYTKKLIDTSCLKSSRIFDTAISRTPKFCTSSLTQIKGIWRLSRLKKRGRDGVPLVLMQAQGFNMAKLFKLFRIQTSRYQEYYIYISVSPGWQL